jgi:predicted RNA binding protein YcfA (HicA-like mRNA interferase family)
MIMPLTHKIITQILSDYHRLCDRQSGSHQQYVKGNHLVTVPTHAEYKPGTALAILKTIASVEQISHRDLINTYHIKL